MQAISNSTCIRVLVEISMTEKVNFILFFCSNVIAATHGVLPAVNGNGAYVVLAVSPPKRTNSDRLRVGFQTYSTDGPIARFMSPDGNFYDIYMVRNAFYKPK